MALGSCVGAEPKEIEDATGVDSLVAEIGATSVASTSEVPLAPVPSATVIAGSWVVVDVVDGDTLDLQGSDGLVRVRLIGINAAEHGECLASEAGDALRFMTGSQQLRLISDVSDVDRFDRKLRYVETLDEVDIGGELVRRGLAIANRYEPDTSRSDVYSALQAEAQAAHAGQWAPDACGAPTETATEVEITIRYDADGDDNLNLNDEWVRFTNNGTATLNVEGWQVADESASHRYTFHTLELGQGLAVTLYTGCGIDTDSERYWCNETSAVWNNSGDTVFLRDPSGNNVVTSTYSG
jgi:micrococcal nuclease